MINQKYLIKEKNNIIFNILEFMKLLYILFIFILTIKKPTTLNLVYPI